MIVYHIIEINSLFSVLWGKIVTPQNDKKKWWFILVNYPVVRKIATKMSNLACLYVHSVVSDQVSFSFTRFTV